MRKYSIGSFFDVWTNDLENWRRQGELLKFLEGLEHIEIMLEYVDITPKELAILDDIIADYKRVVHAPFMGVSLLSPHKEIVRASVQILEKTIKIAKNLNAEVITFHAETYPSYMKKEQVEEIIVKELNDLSQRMEIKIGIENISYKGGARITYPSDPEQFISLYRKLSKNVGFTLDTGHFMIDQHDPGELLTRVIYKVFDIHLHDTKGKKSHLSLGDGEFNIKEFIYLLEKNEYSGFLTLEVMGEEEVYSSWQLLRKMTNT